MNTQQSVALQLGFWRGALEGVVGDCTPEVLNENLPGATITSIGSIYAHTVWAEDAIVNGMLQGKSPLFLQDGWEQKTGLKFPGIPPEMDPSWARGARVDLAPFGEYAKAVFASTDAYLSSASDADMQRKIPMPMGEQSVEWVISVVLATHLPQHLGEMAALKGVQGLKGLPF